MKRGVLAPPSRSLLSSLSIALSPPSLTPACLSHLSQRVHSRATWSVCHDEETRFSRGRRPPKPRHGVEPGYVRKGW